MNFGLKIWSTNLRYREPAADLYREGIIKYIELFVVPDTLSTIPLWKELKVPFALHAPHSYAGLNLSIKEQFCANQLLMEQIEIFRSELSPFAIIFHPGINGEFRETVRQLQVLRMSHPEVLRIAVIENKPYRGMNGEICVGYDPLQISAIMESSGAGLCLDLGHALCAAASLAADWHEFVRRFIAMRPSIIHISDGFAGSEIDQHLNIGHGDLDLRWIIRKVAEDIPISIETKKNSDTDLSDFRQDAIQLRKLAL